MNPIEEARAVLRNGQGWTKGTLDNGSGSYCLVGACYEIEAFYNGAFTTFDVVVPIEAVVLEQYPDRVRGMMAPVVNFNDHPDTTWADVDRVLDKAAVRWEERV